MTAKLMALIPASSVALLIAAAVSVALVVKESYLHRHEEPLGQRSDRSTLHLSVAEWSVPLVLLALTAVRKCEAGHVTHMQRDWQVRWDRLKPG